MSADLANWFFDNFAWMGKYWPNILSGFFITLKLLFFSLVLGYPLAIIVGFGRLSKNSVIYGLATGFVSVIRGTLLLVQLFVYYYGFGSLFPAIPGIRHSFIWPVLKDG